MFRAPDTDIESLLSALAEEIDVPESKYRDAQMHYRAVGDWLAADGSALSPFNVSVFAQGSFALGTAIKPPEGCDYDVDAVCLLKRPPEWSQERLKAEVGERLRSHARYREMLKPPEGGRRCWTLQYADGSQFHLDILPAKPDTYSWLIEIGVPQKYAECAVQITCRDSYGDIVWPKSNPAGYLRWFVDRMRVRFEEARKNIAKARAADVLAIPEYAVRTPLQRVVQILKRQRDAMFGDDPDRPISIIITTLAARAYQNEGDLPTAYQNVVRGMRPQVQQVGDKYVILNPVNPLENFADRWQTHPERQTRFFEWLSALEETERELSSSRSPEEGSEILLKSFGPSGSRAASRAAATLGSSLAQSSASQAVTLSENLGSVLQASHREKPRWPMADTSYRATVSAKAKRTGFRTVPFSDRSPSAPLNKGMDLWFRLNTNVPEPFEVYWQVVNTGSDAAAEGGRGLRGGFERGNAHHHETTQYRGRHSIQAFIVKDERCVANSRPVYVLIK